MELILNITSYHRLSPEIEASKTVKDSLIFGRSEACDWHLPDPEKIISSKHGRIERDGDSFVVIDTSTNGIYSNYSVSAIGQGNKQKLSDSDILTVGDFQIEVKIAEAKSVTPVIDEFSSVTTAKANNAATQSQYFDSNGNNSNSAHFYNDSIMNEPMPDVSMTQTVDSQSQSHIPENWDEIAHLLNPEIVNTSDQHAISSHAEPNIAEPKTEVPTAVDTQPEVAKEAHTLAHTVRPKVETKPIANSVGLTGAFLKGLGVKPELQNALTTEKLWFEMGQGLNLLLTELMESLRQRALVKNQLRVNQTMFQTQQNNPIKFSANIDDVIQNLFIINSASFLSSRESIKESFIDTRRHEHALLAGADGVLKGILEQVSPSHINQQVNNHANILKIIPGQSESKSWKLYQNLHDELSRDVNAKGAMALSDDFLKAYNDKIQETF
ncbi:type VI secretion system-associated FHA domain protein TagH [Pseudoalteromonas arctica]|uniref:Type VI secretion system-associated FHA domain protein TagH n=2 Tax=Pseudoalteromonas arctica TaxID=394751 RepID=A0A7Y0DV34_9GAMM|nr:type VI secretion system-associated FHA domain protein TagH [Pseudoalteromonas arctica]